MKLARSWSRNSLLARWRWGITGTAALRAIRGILVRGPAVRRPVRHRLRPPGALRSAWDQRRLARYLRRLHAAVALDCAQLSGSCRVPGPWHFPGAWTSLGPFAEAWKTARWFWMRFTVRMERTELYMRTRRLIGMPISTGGNFASAIWKKISSLRRRRRRRKGKRSPLRPRSRKRSRKSANAGRLFASAPRTTADTTTPLWKNFARWG